MGKKPRSQRRKKGSNFDDDDDDKMHIEVDVLSEDHTVADTIATFDEFDNDDDDLSVGDLISTGSAGTSTSQASPSRHAKLVDCLSLAADIVGEKRSAKRESGLRRIFRGLTQYATYQTSFGTIQNYRNEIVQASVHGLRVGNPAEQYAACRVLEALAVVLGGDQDDYVEEEIGSPLKRVVAMAGRADMVRGAALRALAMAHFICASSDDVKTESLLDLCELVASPEYRNHAVPPLLRSTALDCWSLLSTTIHDLYISGNDDAHTGRGLLMLPLLKSALEDPSLELRAAAGECIAIIHESRLKLGDNGSENATERKFSQGSWENSEYEDIMSEIQQCIAELSNQSGHYLSKKAKKEQRAAFREFQATIVDDEEPEETVAFRGGSMTLTSWKEIVQLNFIRHCLQGGFQIQLLTNPTLQTIFGADGQVLGNCGSMTQLEKRLILSKTSEASKAAYQDMAKKRRVRNNVKNHFLISDGEDI